MTETEQRRSGKVAIVTGAAPRGSGVGIGKATTILFARQGARVLLVNRSEGRVRTVISNQFFTVHR